MEMYNKLYALIESLLTLIYENGLELDEKSSSLLQDL